MTCWFLSTTWFDNIFMTTSAESFAGGAIFRGAVGFFTGGFIGLVSIDRLSDGGRGFLALLGTELESGGRLAL